MKGILLLNGRPYGGQIEASGAFVVCCDGAYGWAKNKVRIDENIGDYDSYDGLPDPPPAQIYPKEKDFTDGEMGMRRLIERGVDSVEIYGGGGGRYDHFLGNLHLLYLAKTHGVRAALIDENSVIFAAGGEVSIKDIEGLTFSVLPFGGPLHIMGSTGCKYAYPRTIGYGECRGISNEAVSGEVKIKLAKDDCALIIVNRGKV